MVAVVDAIAAVIVAPAANVASEPSVRPMRLAHKSKPPWPRAQSRELQQRLPK